jgi:peptidyl-prolyl cis-trans isomerase SurA
MRKFFTIISLLCLIALTPSAIAAEKISIIATVGDEAITTKDLLHRLKITIMSAGIQGDSETVNRLKPKALRELVDEKMYILAAKKNGYDIDIKQVDEAIATLEKQNNMPTGGLMGMMTANQVPTSAMREKIKGEISQAYLIAREVTPKIEISDAEVADFITAESQVTTRQEYSINEIVLPVNLPSEEEQILQQARNLKEQIKNGANFADIAKANSKSPSSRAGGKVGWLDTKQIPEEIISVLTAQGLNKILGPIRSVEGYYLIIVDGERVVSSAGDNDLVELRHFFAAPKDAKDINAKQKISSLNNIGRACLQSEVYAKENSVGLQNFGRVRVGELPSGIRNIMTGLDTAKFSSSALTPSGYSTFIICERAQKTADDPTQQQKDDAKELLKLKKTELAAKKYFRELRSKTNIDVRL